MGQSQTSKVSDPAFEQLDLGNLTVAVRDAAKGGFERQYQASPSACEVLGSLIGLGEITEFQTDYQIEPLKNGRFRMVAHLRGRIVQNCVASLKVLDNRIDEKFFVFFVPEQQFERLLGDGQDDPDSDDDFEPVIDGRLEVGRVIYEHLAGAIDPYPRAKDTEFSQENDTAEDGGGEVGGPFSALAGLRKDDGKA